MNWCLQIKTVLEIESLQHTWTRPRDQMFYSTERDCTHWVSDVTVPNGVTSCNILYKYQSMANDDYFYLKSRFSAFGSLVGWTRYILSCCNTCERKAIKLISDKLTIGVTVVTIRQRLTTKVVLKHIQISASYLFSALN